MPRPLVLACGALVTELRAVLGADGLTDEVDVEYLPATLHNRPEQIVPALDEALARHGDLVDRPVLVAYADCGTGGLLDAYLEQRPHLRRLPGAHCYEFFSGHDVFEAEHEREPGTFYLTDFLAKHFDALVWGGLGLDRHPQLRDTYFGNYTRVLLMSQSADPAILDAARTAAARLGLPLVHRHVGLEPFARAVVLSVRGAPR